MIEKNFKKLQFSLLGQDSSLEGDLKFQGDTIICCKVKGSITMMSQSKLTLERGSSVDGEIYCHDIEIFGSFSGSITASGNLSIRSSANISGKMNAQKMNIYPGAQVNMEGHTTTE